MTHEDKVYDCFKLPGGLGGALRTTIVEIVVLGVGTPNSISENTHLVF
jgi:hypothetical protein